MAEKLTEQDLAFRALCVDQIQRLGVFAEFQYMNAAGRKELRKFFEARTRDIAKVESAMDELIGWDKIPTLFDIAGVWNRLNPAKHLEPVVSDEERQARAEHLRDWYAAEAEQAKARRAEYLARIAGQLPESTDAVLERLRASVPIQQSEAVETL